MSVVGKIWKIIRVLIGVFVVALVGLLFVDDVFFSPQRMEKQRDELVKNLAIIGLSSLDMLHTQASLFKNYDAELFGELEASKKDEYLRRAKGDPRYFYALYILERHGTGSVTQAAVDYLKMGKESGDFYSILTSYVSAKRWASTDEMLADPVLQGFSSFVGGDIEGYKTFTGLFGRISLEAAFKSCRSLGSIYGYIDFKDCQLFDSIKPNVQ